VEPYPFRHKRDRLLSSRHRNHGIPSRLCPCRHSTQPCLCRDIHHTCDIALPFDSPVLFQHERPPCLINNNKIC
jgi:hypothetical protein